MTDDPAIYDCEHGYQHGHCWVEGCNHGRGPSDARSVARRARRLRAGPHLEGWHEGYRFAVENADDPMVLADADDYGTGWAGHMRVGHLTIVVGEPPDGDGSAVGQ